VSHELDCLNAMRRGRAQFFHNLVSHAEKHLSDKPGRFDNRPVGEVPA